MRQNQSKPILKFKRLYDDARLPKRATPESACLDVYAHGTYDVYSHLVSTPAMIGTGVAMDIPKGYHVEVYLRSGVAAKTFLRLAKLLQLRQQPFPTLLKSSRPYRHRGL